MRTSFSSEVKEELKETECRARHCNIAEFSAIFILLGQIRRNYHDEVYLKIHTENLTVAQKSYILIRSTFNAKVEVRVQNHNVRSSVMSYSIIVKRKNDVVSILKALKIIDEQRNQWGDFLSVHYMIVQNTCCKRAFLRGIFMAAGSVTNPKKAYHLEIAVLSSGLAEQVKEITACFDIDAKIIMRKKYYVVYIKEGAQIVDFLNVIGAHIALMNYENVRIVKEVRNFVNRQVNCETANISKTVNAAARQIEDIEYIRQNMGFGMLSDGLREIAELRLEYPDSSLSELGEMLEKPIGKSGVNHRLRKLSNIANQIKEM